MVVACDPRSVDATEITVFSTFDMDQLGKILRHHWKERIKISKLAKFESDTIKSERGYSSSKFRKFIEIFTNGTSIKLRDFSFVFNKSLSLLAIFLI